MVDPDGRNQIAVASGANYRLTGDMVRQEATIAWAQVLLYQLETPLPAVRSALELARDHGVTAVLNPAPAQPLGDDLLALVDYLTPNEVEAGMLSGIAVRDLGSAREAAERLGDARRPLRSDSELIHRAHSQHKQSLQGRGRQA